MNALFALESKSFSHSYLEILLRSPDIARGGAISGSPAEYPNGQNRDDGLQIGFREIRFGCRTDRWFGLIGAVGPALDISIPHRDLRLAGTGWTVWVPGELARRRERGFIDTHNRLSSCRQSVVWFLTRRPGAVPGLVTGYLPETDADCRTARESVSNPGRKSASGRTVRTLGCSSPSTGRVPKALDSGCLDSIP